MSKAIYCLRTNKRSFYLAMTVFWLAVEVVIACYVHDRFIRPYVGDVLVVVVVYCFARIWVPQGVRLLPLYVFLFAAGVEVLQYFHLVELLGVGNNTFLRVVLGSVFDLKDILCYGIGCVFLEGFERVK